MAGAVGFTGQSQTATMADQSLANSQMFKDAFQMMSFNNNFGPVFADMRRAGHEKTIAKMQIKAQKKQGGLFGGKSMGGIGAAAGTGIGMALAAPTGGLSMLEGGILGGAMGGGVGSAF